MTTDSASTAGASSLDVLTGERVRLWPYAPGVYGRDALYRVWQAMEDDGATKQAFWDEAYCGETGGDLVSFVRAFSEPSRLLWLIESHDTHQLCGSFWVTQMVPGHQAFVGMWMRKEARGACSREAARLALRETFEAGGFRQLWALTPWAPAAALCRRMGFVYFTALPDFCQWQGTLKMVRIFRLTKEAFNGLNLQERQ